MIVNNPPIVSPSQLYLLASATVDANALATTALTWQNGASAANSIPLCGRIYRVTGTLSLLIGSLLLNSVVIQAVSAVQSALMGAGADPIHYPISSAVSVGIIPISGNYGFTVGTINGGASTIRVEVWGYRTS